MDFLSDIYIFNAINLKCFYLPIYDRQSEIVKDFIHVFAF